MYSGLFEKINFKYLLTVEYLFNYNVFEIKE